MTPLESRREPASYAELRSHDPGNFARRRREGWVRAEARIISILAVLLLLFSGIPLLARAAQPGNHQLQVLSLTVGNQTSYTRNFTTHQTVHFWGNITGGFPNSTCTVTCNSVLLHSGYHLFFFFGQSNASGNLSVSQQFYPDPGSTSCSGRTQPCTAVTSIQAQTPLEILSRAL